MDSSSTISQLLFQANLAVFSRVYLGFNGASRTQIVEVYGSRFSIEIAIREMKSQFGWLDYQSTSYLAIQRFMHLACVSFSLWRLALLEALANLTVSLPVDEWLALPVQPSCISESPLSFERIRRALRRCVIRQINSRKSALSADLDNYSQADSWIEHLIA